MRHSNLRGSRLRRRSRFRLPLGGVDRIGCHRCGHYRRPAGKGIAAAGRCSAGKCRGGSSTAQVAGYLIRKAGSADTVCVGNRILLDRSIQNKAPGLRRSSRFCLIISICNNFLMVVCKMRQIRLGICYAIGFCAISNRTGATTTLPSKDSLSKEVNS